MVNNVFPKLLKLASVCSSLKKVIKIYERITDLFPYFQTKQIFERIIHTRLYDFLEECNIFYDLQFGVRKRYSTNHALLSIVKEILSILDNNTFSCGVFVDLEKAFDSVNHMIL